MRGAAPGWWFCVDDGGTFACAPPKCGLMSLQTSLAHRAGVERPARLPRGERARFSVLEHLGIGPYPAHIAAELGKTRLVLAVREPVDRFRSLWCHRRHQGRDESPRELLRLVESFPSGDPHWFPQYLYRVPRVELVRYDRLLEELRLPPARENRSQVPWPTIDPRLADQVRRHYVHDVRLWSQAC